MDLESVLDLPLLIVVIRLLSLLFVTADVVRRIVIGVLMIILALRLINIS
jgi:hypothetical protein